MRRRALQPGQGADMRVALFFWMRRRELQPGQGADMRVALLFFVGAGVH